MIQLKYLVPAIIIPVKPQRRELMISKELDRALEAVECLDPEWKVGKHSPESNVRTIWCLIETGDGVIKCAMEASRQKTYERSEIKVLLYRRGCLDAKGMPAAYDKVLTLFSQKHLVEARFSNGFLGLFPAFRWPDEFPEDHCCLIECVDMFACPEYEQRATEKAEKDRSVRTDETRYREAFLGTTA